MGETGKGHKLPSHPLQRRWAQPLCPRRTSLTTTASSRGKAFSHGCSKKQTSCIQLEEAEEEIYKQGSCLEDWARPYPNEGVQCPHCPFWVPSSSQPPCKALLLSAPLPRSLLVRGVETGPQQHTPLAGPWRQLLVLPQPTASSRLSLSLSTRRLMFLQVCPIVCTVRSAPALLLCTGKALTSALGEQQPAKRER